MAENDAAEEGGEEIQVGNRSKLPFILGAVAVFLIGGGIGWAVTLLTAASDPASDASEAADASEDEEKGSKDVLTEMTNLGSFTVNLRDSSGGRVLQMEIQVESDSEMAESIEGRMPQLRDSVILLASDYSYTELEGIDGKFRLKDDIHARVNAVLEPIQVRRVYFTEFVVQ
jgi:flagellar basal body-associated protein FliL